MREIRIDLSVSLEIESIGNKILLLNTERYFFASLKMGWLPWEAVSIAHL